MQFHFQYLGVRNLNNMFDKPPKLLYTCIRKREGKPKQTGKGFQIMKTVDVVKMPKGWYVTRRWGGMNKGAEFFPFGTKKKERKAADAAKDAYIKEWMGE
jgi:hypothetical protein